MRFSARIFKIMRFSAFWHVINLVYFSNLNCFLYKLCEYGVETLVGDYDVTAISHQPIANSQSPTLNSQLLTPNS